ncbi:MAG TPA: ABC transporter substrate-binding protein [Stellaceae bacterium]|nr:ABC transporter substrate-binding protein [Stellaceae bacterium]
MGIDRAALTRRRFTALAAAGIAAPAIISRARADSLVPLRVDYDGYSISTGPLYYGLKKGIFKKHGLDLTINFMQDGTTLTQAVIGGSVAIAQNGYTSSISAAVQGADNVYIANLASRLPFQLVTPADIKTGADLKGKRIAISRIGASTDTALTFALQHLGLKRTDVVILQLGAADVLTKALMTGQISGCVVQMPRSVQMEETGKYRILVDATVVAGEYPNVGYVTTRKYLKEHRDIAKNFVMGISESIHDWKTDKPGALALTAEYLKIPNSTAMEKTWENFAHNVFPDIPYPSLKGIQLVLDDLKPTHPAAAKAKPEQFVDNSIIDELVKEGFYKKLMG